MVPAPFVFSSVCRIAGILLPGICLLSCIYPVPSFCNSISLEGAPARLDVPLGETLAYTLRLSWSGEQDLYRVVHIVDPHLERFEIGASTVEQKNVVENDRRISEYITRYELVPREEGKGRIGTITVQYRIPPDTTTYHLTTAEYAITITPPSASFAEGRTIPAIVILGMLCILAAYFVFGRKVKRYIPAFCTPNEEEDTSDQISSPREEALEKVAQLKNARISGKIRDLYAEIPGILSTYLVRRFDLMIPRSSWEDIIRIAGKMDIESDRIQQLHHFRQECEKVLFAATIPAPEEIDSFLKKVVEWLEQIDRSFVDQ
jgi:hypothetical protein